MFFDMILFENPQKLSIDEKLMEDVIDFKSCAWDKRLVVHIRKFWKVFKGTWIALQNQR